MGQSNIYRKGLNYILETGDGDHIKIPSQRFPLNNSPQLFTYENTEPADEYIQDIFDSLHFQLGHCYSNTKGLVEALNAAGIAAESYVGWITCGGDLPVHHCWCVVDGTKVLDAGVFLKTKDLEKYAGLSYEEAANLFAAERIRCEQSMPNSENFICGMADPLYAYIGCPCSPEKGQEIYRKLIQAFPHHPSYRNLQDPYGRSAAQELYDKLKRREGV